MSDAGRKILAGAAEMVEIAKGNQPAASITVQGHRYFPAEDAQHAAAIFYRWACEEIVVEGCRKDRDPDCFSCRTIAAFEQLAELLDMPELAKAP